jgi:hypothetical protein
MQWLKVFFKTKGTNLSNTFTSKEQLEIDIFELLKFGTTEKQVLYF